MSGRISPLKTGNPNPAVSHNSGTQFKHNDQQKIIDTIENSATTQEVVDKVISQMKNRGSVASIYFPSGPINIQLTRTETYTICTTYKDEMQRAPTSFEEIKEWFQTKCASNGSLDKTQNYTIDDNSKIFFDEFIDLSMNEITDSNNQKHDLKMLRENCHLGSKVSSFNQHENFSSGKTLESLGTDVHKNIYSYVHPSVKGSLRQVNRSWHNSGPVTNLKIDDNLTQKEFEDLCSFLKSDLCHAVNINLVGNKWLFGEPQTKLEIISQILDKKPHIKLGLTTNKPIKSKEFDSLLQYLKSDKCKISALQFIDAEWLILKSHSSPPKFDKLCAALKDQPQIKTLTLINCGLNETNISNIALATHLTNLNLSKNNIKDAGAQHISKMNLENLNISENEITDIGARDISAMKLESLDISKNNIKSTGAQHISTMNLKNLNISENKIKDTGTQHINKMNLENLNISENKITEIGARDISAMKLESLDISKNNIIDIGAVYISTMNLKNLNIGDNEITGIGAQSISNMNLENLDISHNHIGDYGAQHISRMKVKNLNISNNKITDIGIQLIDIMNLESLDVSDNDIETSGAEHISKMKLKSLNISNCYIQVSGAEHISKMKLKSLNISNCYIQDSGAEHISKMELESLNISNNDIGNTAAKHISTMNLKSLDISDNYKITDIGAEYISKMKNLKSLDISTNNNKFWYSSAY